MEFESPFDLPQAKKCAGLLPILNALTRHHAASCAPYRNMIEAAGGANGCATSIEEVPFLPVRVFKHLELKSVPEESIVRTLNSSGTTGHAVSKIFLDVETSQRQVRALASIMGSLLGKQRLPMLIIDQKSMLTNRAAFNARAAGVIGFSNFGRHHFYLLDDEMRVDWEGLGAFLHRFEGQDILIFGFTHVVWKYFFQAARAEQRQVDFGPRSILVHGGGWKRLQEEQVDNQDFKQALAEQFGIRRVANYYGMVEQVGSIFIECEAGHLHAPRFAEIVVRDPFTLEIAPIGAAGAIQVLSGLPLSYPGHSILTEDIGAVLGIDDCRCGRMGKYFRVDGRIAQAEARGCSDVRAA